MYNKRGKPAEEVYWIFWTKRIKVLNKIISCSCNIVHKVQFLLFTQAYYSQKLIRPG